MEYVFAFICPPLAVWFCRGFRAALLNFVLCLLLWLPGVLHALLVARQYRKGKRENRFLNQMQNRWLSLSVKKM